MAELKTKKTQASVPQFISAIEDDQKRQEAKALVSMMTKATGSKPVMWGSSIVGFGDFEYTGSNGKSNKWFLVGFSPRKAALTLYLMGGKDKELLAKLGNKVDDGRFGASTSRSSTTCIVQHCRKLIAESLRRVQGRPHRLLEIEAAGAP